MLVGVFWPVEKRVFIELLRFCKYVIIWEPEPEQPHLTPSSDFFSIFILFFRQKYQFSLQPSSLKGNMNLKKRTFLQPSPSRSYSSLISGHRPVFIIQATRDQIDFLPSSLTSHLPPLPLRSTFQTECKGPGRTSQSSGVFGGIACIWAGLGFHINTPWSLNLR